MNLANRMSGLSSTELLMLMELAGNKDMISFAGGFPSDDVFPYAPMEAVTKKIFQDNGPSVLQYATTSGYEPLREVIAQRIVDRYEAKASLEDILITSGSQQALGMLGLMLLNKGDVVLVESPTYIGALNAFKAYEPDFIEIPTDDEGMNITSLKNILERRALDVKMVYVIPDFQNPTGRYWSKERRSEFMSVMSEFDIPIVEDMAYYELAYENLERPTLKSMDVKDQVISLGTFSKIFCPGLRVGWVHGNKTVIDTLKLIKPNMDLSSPSIGQLQVYEYMKAYDLDAHIIEACKVYKRRRDIMMTIFEKKLSEKVTYTKPKGGLFTWLELPEGKDSKSLFELTTEKGVAFVPGNSFYPKSHMPGAMRVNFSNMDDEMIEKGANILVEVINTYVNS